MSSHVRSGSTKPIGKANPINPSNRMDNCVACVSASIRKSINSQFEDDTADDIERIFGYTGAERKIQLSTATEYIQKATGLRIGKLIDWQNTSTAGNYVIFGGTDNRIQHVVHGIINGSKKVIFDPQIQKEWSYFEFIGRYNGIRTFPIS